MLNVASSAAGFLTKEQVARRVLGIALRAADMEAGAVWAAEDQGDRTVVLARRGRAEVSCDPLEVSMDKPCAVSRVIRSGVPSYGLVGGDECGLCRGASGGTRFAAVLPVASKGRVLGAVALFSLISRRVSRKDKALLARITYQLAVALENAALREQSARDREFLSSVIDHLPVGVLIVDAEQMSVVGANGVAGDGTYGIVLPAQANGYVMLSPSEAALDAVAEAKQKAQDELPAAEAIKLVTSSEPEQPETMPLISTAVSELPFIFATYA